MGEPGNEGEGRGLSCSGGGATGGSAQRHPERDAGTDGRLAVPPRQRAFALSSPHEQQHPMRALGAKGHRKFPGSGWGGADTNTEFSRSNPTER